VILAIDIGNTNIKFGIFSEGKFIKCLRLPSDNNITENEYLSYFEKEFAKFSIKKCIISSVVEDLSLVIKKISDKFFNIDSILLSSESKFGMQILVENKKRVGVDRLVNSSYIRNHFKLPAVVVDIGTATTIDVINKDGNFVGGAILPGINLQFKSLNINTSKLPHINERNSEFAIGKSTEEAILSGVLRGHSSSIEGIIEQMEKELGESVKIILTGGDSVLVSKYMIKNIDLVNPNLTLESLVFLYENNKENVLCKK